LDEFISTIKGTIAKYGMISQDNSVLVSVSGGPDSVCLLHVLNDLKNEYSLTLNVAHLNHGLRGKESDRDETFVLNMAENLNITCVTERADLYSYKKERRLSTQAAGRELRYSFLKRTAKKFKIDKIALGHTAEDQAETIIMRILRGSGVHGLGGISPVREGSIIRPLIECEKREVMEYLNENKIPFTTDRSNLDQKYTRNKIRHSLLPILRSEYNANLNDSLCNLSETARNDDQLLDILTLEHMKNLTVKEGRHFLELDILEFRK